MRKRLVVLHASICLLLVCSVISVSAQQAAPAAANAVVPPVVKFSGVLTDVNNKPLTGTVGVTFSLYKESEGSAALWVETQNVTPDKTGHYSVMLGSTTSQGIPADVFANGEARWLGVQAQGQAEQPRTLLMSVPYALKALDAETVGGKPASSFMLAPKAGGSAVPGKLPPGTITGSGTADYIPRFSGATTLGNSDIFETVAGNVGIATTAPAAKLDVKGTEDVRNTLTLFPSATHPTLSVHGTAFEVSSTGLVTFVSGQTFPGTGTITGVTAGTDLTGGGTSGTVTLNLDTTKVPLLASNNAFTGNNSFSGTVGIGMTAPTRAFEVSVPGTTVAQMVMLTNGTDAALSLDNTGSGGHEYWIDSGSGGAGVGAGNLAVWDNTVAAPRLVVNPSGNVGIGTTTPGAGLSMSGGLTINAAGYTAFSAQYQGANAFALNPGSSGNWALYDYASGSWTPGITQEGGNVGIGTASPNSALGVVATSETQDGAGYFATGFADQVGLWGVSTAPSNDVGYGLVAGGTGYKDFCSIDQKGDLLCWGSKSAVVPVDGGSRTVALYAVESPENWFEDYGSGQLSNGSARIDLEPTFAQTVNTDLDYHVFLTPRGECEGLYVTNLTPSGFEVRELHKGSSSVAFDYRIIAKRKNYETVRLADLTERYKKLDERLARMRSAAMRQSRQC
jgi:hypothetical protein